MAQADELPTRLVDEVSAHLKCPVCGRLYIEPVINIRCGHTFCRKCAFGITHCPVDSSNCDTSQLVINRLVVGQIDDLLIYCRYGLEEEFGEWEIDQSGCTEHITLGKREDHESCCEFAVVSCPNTGECGSFRRKEVQRHLQQCSYTSCVHSDSGCEFRGTPGYVEEHVKLCGYREGGDLGATRVAQKVENLEKTNLKLEQQVSELTQRVTELEGSQSELVNSLEKNNSIIQNLQQKVTELQSTMEVILNGRSRRSFGSQMSLPDSGMGDSRPLSSNPGSPTGNAKYERWEMPFQFKCIGTLRGHLDTVWCLASYKGRLYSAGADHLIKVWNLDQLSQGCVQTITGHAGIVFCMTVTRGCLYTAGDDHSLRVWDTDTGGSVKTVENAHDNIVCAMVTNREHIFTSSFSLIKVWEVKTLKMIHSMSGLHHWVRAMALSYKQDKLYSGSHNAINIWETADPFSSLHVIEHELGSVHSLAITQTYIIAGNSGTYNQNIQIFNAINHEHITNLCGHIGTVTSLCVSPSGNFLFSGSHDSNVQVWSLEKMLPIQTLQRHQASVNTVTLYRNILLSGSEDHEIKVFRYFQLQH